MNSMILLSTQAEFQPHWSPDYFSLIDQYKIKLETEGAMGYINIRIPWYHVFSIALTVQDR
jgi:hypothetical protein